MSKERFKNYIQEVERETTCGEFLKENRDFVMKLTQDSEKLQEYNIHKALSNLKRYIIYKLLENKPMCTCALANVLQVSDSTITHHLKILESAGLIVGKKEGYFTRYFIIKELIAELS